MKTAPVQAAQLDLDALVGCVRPLLRALAVELADELARRGADGDLDQASPALQTLRVSRRRFMAACRSGELASRRCGRRWVVRRADLDAWLGARTSKPSRPGVTAARSIADDVRGELGLVVPIRAMTGGRR